MKGIRGFQLVRQAIIKVNIDPTSRATLKVNYTINLLNKPIFLSSSRMNAMARITLVLKTFCRINIFIGSHHLYLQDSIRNILAQYIPFSII